MLDAMESTPFPETLFGIPKLSEQVETEAQSNDGPTAGDGIESNQ
jgi:hypothetical protein